MKNLFFTIFIMILSQNAFTQTQEISKQLDILQDKLSSSVRRIKSAQLELDDAQKNVEQAQYSINQLKTLLLNNSGPKQASCVFSLYIKHDYFYDPAKKFETGVFDVIEGEPIKITGLNLVMKLFDISSIYKNELTAKCEFI